MYRTDVVSYGNDLDDWLHREFGVGAGTPAECRATVPFWRDLVS
jgi:hypothetical protein